MFNLDAHSTEPELEQVPPVALIGAEDDFGIGEDFKGAAVGTLNWA